MTVLDFGTINSKDSSLPGTEESDHTETVIIDDFSKGKKKKS